jgi:hypothetical protein
MSDPRPPDLDSRAGKAWQLPAPPPEFGPDTTVGRWLVNVPGAHPFWSWYLVACCHLRDHPGLPPAVRHYPAAAYEFQIVALDPKHPPATDGATMLHTLSPPEAIVQFHGVDDAGAAEVCQLAIRAIVEGRMSPDSDYRRAWARLIPGTAECIAKGHPGHQQN